MNNLQNLLNNKYSFKKSALIINPVSGKNDGQDRAKLIKKIATSLGWKGKLYKTTKTKNAQSICKELLKQNIDHIIVCGGDGTIMEAVSSIVNTNIVLGIVPLGTGNLCAQNLNISLDLKEALTTAISGNKVSIDVGKANNIYFTIIAGMGLDADMIQGASTKLKNKIGFVAYIISTIRSLVKPSNIYKVTIDQDEKITVLARSILVANMGKIPGGVEIVPHANPQNGTLQVGIIQTNEATSWFSLIGSILSGNINKSPHYKLFRGKEIKIQSLKKKHPFQCDGNVFPSTDELNISIYPQALTVLVT